VSTGSAPANLTDHSFALCANFRGSFMSIAATSASCGSFGSGDASSPWIDISAVLSVKTGDHAVDKVSRQIAPCQVTTVSSGRLLSSFMIDFLAEDYTVFTHRLTANIWMPYACLELHNWRSKWVIIWNLNINAELSTFIRRIRWSCK